MHGPIPSGSFVVSCNLTCPPISEAFTVYVAVTVEPVTVLGEIVPEPEMIDQVAPVALPPMVPLTGMLTGSHAAKFGPAFTVAIGFTVAVTMVVGPLQAFAAGVMV